METKYIFSSERLGFRNWEEADIPSYHQLSSDPEVMKYFPVQYWLDADAARVSVSRFVNHYRVHGYTYFAVDIIETQEFIGFIGMKSIDYEAFFAPAVDIGWRFAKEYWGRGFATEGAKQAMAWFFENFSEQRLVSLTTIGNSASENVMKKIGMEKICEFNHPLLGPSEALLKHVLYEILTG